MENRGRETSSVRVTLLGQDFMVTGDGHIDRRELELAVRSRPFIEWVGRCRGRFMIRHARVQSVDLSFTGPGDQGLGVHFLKVMADVEALAPDRRCGGKAMPSVTFMRGDSVGVLVVLECQGREYAALVCQPRPSTGEVSFEEIPAGMLDGKGFVGAAAIELGQELGPDFANIAEADLVPLTDRPFFLSPGACDERMRLFVYRRAVTRAQLAALADRIAGSGDAEYEYIHLKIVPVETLLDVPDAKTQLAALHYLRGRG